MEKARQNSSTFQDFHNPNPPFPVSKLTHLRGAIVTKPGQTGFLGQLEGAVKRQFTSLRSKIMETNVLNGSLNLKKDRYLVR